jgi:hypothetical protein
MKISFRLLPASWGLRGDAYLEAEAHYILSGEALDKRLMEIRYKLEPDVLVKKLLDVDLKHKKINQYEYDTKLVDLNHTDEDLIYIKKIDVDLKHKKITAYDADIKRIELNLGEDAQKLAVLEIDYKHKKIIKSTYDKEKSTIKNEPWVSFVDSEFDPEKGLDGFYFELDWNTQFIEFLTINGFVGHTDEQIVEDWFGELCKSHGKENWMPLNRGSYPYPMGFDENDPMGFNGSA